MSTPVILHNPVDVKAVISEGEHVEDLKEHGTAEAVYSGEDALVSSIADLTPREAMRRFWRLFLIGFSVSVSGM